MFWTTETITSFEQITIHDIIQTITIKIKKHKAHLKEQLSLAYTNAALTAMANNGKAIPRPERLAPDLFVEDAQHEMEKLKQQLLLQAKI